MNVLTRQTPALKLSKCMILREAQKTFSWSRLFSTSSLQLATEKCHGGAGIGNVHDQMLPATDFSGMFKHIKRPKTASVIGAPMTHGQPFVGTDHGPQLLRDENLIQHLSSIGWRVRDKADLNFDSLSNSLMMENESTESPKARNSKIVGKGCSMLADSVETEILKGRFPVVLGGDHSIAIGTLAGILRVRPNIGVIWVDAHADLHTPETSESGNMHGMPVGLLMEGLANDCHSFPGLEWLHTSPNGKLQPRLSPDSIVYIGLRDVDAAERDIIRQNNIKAFTMHDVDNVGIGKVMEMALAHLLDGKPDRPIHLSYDIDAVDPMLAPATGTTVRGGLNYRDAHFVAETVAMSGALTSIEIVELNPTLSDGRGSRKTVELGLGLLTSLMGKSII
mmetsp:Transcript_9667/g.9326  ORF Transcript_9667/g.9326 Transcript_9667/m.9326 type:complete len:393 (-) Transcript_9667:185-1363(-)